MALTREVAVKVLADRYAPDSATAARFLEESPITAQLQHPGIPAVYQVGTLPGGRPFLAMKPIKGETLDVLLKANAPVDPLEQTSVGCSSVSGVPDVVPALGRGNWSSSRPMAAHNPSTGRPPQQPFELGER